MLTSRHQRFPIERYAALTENAPALGQELDEWYGFYRPSTPAECTLLDMTVMASVQQRRVLECLTETVNQQVRTAEFQFDCGQEDEVQHYRDMLETRPGVAVVGLKRSALGVRFLIGRFERLLRLLEEDGTLYGNDRDEFIQYQGARATNPENLYASEAAYMIWLYCIMCQPKPRDEDLVAIGNERFMPAGLMDRKIETWVGEVELSRKLLKELAERELAQLRPREALLRIHYEIPARDGAEVRKQVLQGPIGARLLREAESHGRHFHRAYNAFLKGRAQSEKSGRLPGAPNPELHGEPIETPPAAAAPAGLPSVLARMTRKQVAAALAPGGANGIAASVPRRDEFRDEVKASRMPETPSPV